MTRFQPYLPCDSLKPYIRQFVISESTLEQTYKILPTTSLVMGFQYRGKLAYLDLDKTTEIPLAISGITGLQNTFRIFKNSPTIGSVLVIFRETGLAAFFKEPINELFGESLSLDTFVRRSVLTVVEEQLDSATNDQERINSIEQFLLARLRQLRPDPLVSLALHYIYQSKGTIRITALMDKLCISQSPLEKRFRQRVGASPKKFSSIVRMNHAIQLFSDPDRPGQIGLESGYFDQAHFSKEFKTFTGVSPTEFLQTSLTC